MSERSRADESPAWPMVASAAVVGFLFAWTLTSPRWLALINWDNGAYLAGMASGTYPWGATPWNAHFAVGHIYWMGIYVARLWNGTFVDGFRLADAAAFAVSAGFIASAALHLTRSKILASLLTAAWMTSWVMVFLLVTLEDNVLFIAPASIVMWSCVTRLDRWGLRESGIAGVLAGSAFLVSWQAILYVIPAIAAALISPTRSPSRQIGHAVVVVQTFFATLVAYCVALALTSSHDTRSLLKLLFARPTGNFSLVSLFSHHEVHAVGVAAIFFAKHTAYDLPATALSPELIGRQVLFGELAVVGGLFLRSWFADWKGDRRPQLLAGTLFVFTLVTPIYRDLDYRYLVRFDFVPLIAALLASCAAARLPRGQGLRRHAAAAGLAALVVTQTALGLGWVERRRASYGSLLTWLSPPHPASVWYGREGQSWYSYFRSLRRHSSPGCVHLFALDEVLEASWNYDIVGSLWSELPDHIVIGEPRAVASWRFRPRMMTIEDAQRFDPPGHCIEASVDARRVLGLP